MEKYSYSGLSWMTQEMKNDIRKRDEIVSNENIESLYLLKDNSDFSIALHEILVKRYDRNPDSLNSVQLDLFLCMHIENAGQADSILSFLQEWFPDQKEQVVISLKEIGANKSAEIIKQALVLLPKDGCWFYDSSNQESEKLMAKLDREFSDYPDGSMPDLYRKYAEKHKRKIDK